MARRRKRGRRRSYSLSNPLNIKGILSKPREMISKEFLTEAVSTAAGFMAPNIVLGYLPVSLRDTTVKLYASKVMVIAGLSVAAGLVSKKASRFVLIGGGVALLMDFWAQWQNRTRPVNPGTSAYYGDEGTSAYYGDNNGMGDDIVMSDTPVGMY